MNLSKYKNITPELNRLMTYHFDIKRTLLANPKEEHWLSSNLMGMAFRTIKGKETNREDRAINKGINRSRTDANGVNCKGRTIRVFTS